MVCGFSRSFFRYTKKESRNTSLVVFLFLIMLPIGGRGGHREHVFLWWLTYMPAERAVDDAALGDALKVARWDAAKIAGIRETFPVHWGRMLAKRELQLAHFRKHGSVPDGVTPGWPLGRNVSQIGPKLKRLRPNLALARFGWVTNVTFASVAPFLAIASACGAVFFLNYWIYKNDPRPRKSLKARDGTSSPSGVRSYHLEDDTPVHAPTSFDTTPDPV
jgi:hypothetical protein